ncbi:GH36-type glycosyl hydrolase domain-containing protein [Alteromonas gracilis]|uniref:GH36-type glycosyl hydrolase domain-containing protein n=1 Tax=Alteromonas gracilis TaxID=1479524 RepID=UPI0030D3BBF8
MNHKNRSDTPIAICSTTRAVTLSSPTALPKACGFLYNQDMMIQMNCRGYAVAQHMQPEPAKYSRGPNIEATTFMQPEHHYYTDHPGRFFYIKLKNNSVFSLPYEPIRATYDKFTFTHQSHALLWHIEKDGLAFDLTLTLGEGTQELWNLTVTNIGEEMQEIDIYPMFTVGYMSWMNQSARYDESLQCVVATCISPYQMSADYKRIANFKDITYLKSSEKPYAYSCNHSKFIGEGYLQAPDGVLANKLGNDVSNYEVPTAVMQHKTALKPDECKALRWAFGAVQSVHDLEAITLTQSEKLASNHTVSAAVEINTGDSEFDSMVNTWLPRQLHYHGQMNRLTTDPQTRNYLQDSMGLIYLNSAKAREHFLTALSQQHRNGDMPDGILLHKDAELKYINQVPHSDHNVWLMWFLKTYLDETGDVALLDAYAGYKDSTENDSVFAHMSLAMESLYRNLDSRGLSLIKEGDWCDPMNGVGVNGVGVSGWLSIATCGAFFMWAGLCESVGATAEHEKWKQRASALNDAIEKHFWCEQWYARGITDEGRTFGIATDKEGSMYLNPQAWAMLSLPLTPSRTHTLLKAVDEHLMTPFGPMMLAPSYTGFQPDIGRLTQKSPGVAENGAIYNHAAAFYVAGLYTVNKGDAAFDVLKKMIPRIESANVTGQLPVYIPNYYRGAYFQFPEQAGRSSHLFNTGTVAWYYHCVINGMLGLQGGKEGLFLKPNIPSCLSSLHVSRRFRGHQYKLHYKQIPTSIAPYWSVDGERHDLSVPLSKTSSTIEVFYHA